MVISRVLSRWFLSWGIVWTMVGYLNESLAYILLGAVFIGLVRDWTPMATEIFVKEMTRLDPLEEFAVTAVLCLIWILIMLLLMKVYLRIPISAKLKI